MGGGCTVPIIKMTLLLLVVMSCLLRLGSTQGNTLSFLSSPGFVRVVGYEGSYNLNIDIKVGLTLTYTISMEVIITDIADQNMA